MRRSPIRCSTKRLSQSWLTASKNPILCSIYKDLPAAQRSRKLSEDLNRYYTTAWLSYDRTKRVCPYPEGTVKAAFWEVLRLVPRSLGDRQLRAIIVGSRM
jgi:hypothetical protein